MKTRTAYIRDAITWCRDASRRMDTAGVRLYAAAIAYRTIFSVVAFTATISLLAFVIGLDVDDVQVGDTEAVGNIENIARERLAAALDFGAGSVIAAGLIGFAVGIYGMAGGFAAIQDVLDRIHGTQEYRRLTVRYLRGAGVAVVFVALISIALALLALTRSVGDFVFGALSLERVAGATGVLLGIIIPAIAIFLAFLFVNRYGSHARPRWTQAIVSALVAGTAWILLFVGFVTFTQLTTPFDTYGALASAVGLLLFGYFQAYVLILTNLFAVELLKVASLLPFVRMTTDDQSLTFGIDGAPR